MTTRAIGTDSTGTDSTGTGSTGTGSTAIGTDSTGTSPTGGDPERLILVVRRVEDGRYLLARWPDWPHPAMLSTLLTLRLSAENVRALKVYPPGTSTGASQTPASLVGSLPSRV